MIKMVRELAKELDPTRKKANPPNNERVPLQLARMVST